MTVNLDDFPSVLRPYLDGANLYDSSCSLDAKVIFIDKAAGYFLKIKRVMEFDRECEMTRYFHGKGLAAKVVEHLNAMGRDYLLTEKLRGDDCVAAKYLEQPERLAESLGERLALLHGLDYSGCPVPNHTERYIFRAVRNYKGQRRDVRHFSGEWGHSTSEEAHEAVMANGHRLLTDTLLHGDYCLPNIIFDDWRFSGFIDLDSGGVGDRHVDLYWGAWTLCFNLNTDKYRDRFLDAYGRHKVDDEMLRIVAACEVFG
jgi:kanamycin kinase